jgi:hypothetical protein
MQLRFTKSEIEKPEKQGENAGQPLPPAISRMTLQTTIKIRDGYSVPVSTMISHSNRKSEEAYLIVSAEIHQADANTVSFRAYSEDGIARPVYRSPSVPNRRVSSSGPATAARDRAATAQRFGELMIRRYDKNGDGELTEDEWDNIRGDMSEIDRDGNGKITAAEYAERILKSRSSGNRE